LTETTRRPLGTTKRFVKRLLVQHSLRPRTSGALLLTFDDGPHPTGTPAVLERLRAFGARSVFFVVGSRIERAPHLLNRILEEGHLLGNHSFAHPLGAQLPFFAYLRDLARCQEAIKRLTGVRPRLYRPPMGHISATSLAAPRFLGLCPTLWSIDTDDWHLRGKQEAEQVADRIIAQCSGRTVNDIVLMHDGAIHTPEVLDRLLPQLRERHIDVSNGVHHL
jgi:peptidoglycan/xylan/chitin deacetylase (PgdA/CDA1 family)